MKLKYSAVLVLIFVFVGVIAANIHNAQAGEVSAEATSELVSPQSIIIFEFSEEELRVTEIITLLNSTGNMLDFKKAPIVKKLPTGAFDVQYIGHNQINPEISSEKLVFTHKAPPGEHRLFFSYSLPASGASFSFTHFLPLPVEKLELISPENVFEVSVEGTGDSHSRVVSRKKRAENSVYDSKTLFLNSGRKQVDILIKNIPISQKKLIYPAAAGATLIFMSLFWYLKRKAKK